MSPLRSVCCLLISSHCLATVMAFAIVRSLSNGILSDGAESLSPAGSQSFLEFITQLPVLTIFLPVHKVP